jgi:hypothetical protein
MFLYTCKQPVIAWGMIWTIGRLCQHLPVPTFHQIFTSCWQCVAFSWSKMTPYSSISGCLWQRVCLTLSCKSAHYSCSCTVTLISMGWSRTSPFLLNNITCMTFRAPWLCQTIFFLSDFWACHWTFYCFRWESNECLHDSSAIQIPLRNALSLFLQSCRCMVAKTHVSLIIIEPLWNPFCTNVRSSKLLVRMWETLAGVSPNSEATVVHEILYKERFHLFHMRLIHRRSWSSSARCIVCLFPAIIINGISPFGKQFIWRNMCP